MSEKFIEVTHSRLRHIDRIAERLHALAAAHAALYQDKLAQELHEAARGLQISVTTIRGAIAEDINRQVAEAQERSGTILAAALAGGEIARREEKTDG